MKAFQVWRTKENTWQPVPAIYQQPVAKPSTAIILIRTNEDDTQNEMCM